MSNANTIPDDKMKASTYYYENESPFLGRLEESRGDGAWCPSTRGDKTDYLQVDMGKVYFVCGVATQGQRIGDYWTNSYKLQFSLDGNTYDFYTENGNSPKVRI